MLEQRQGFTKLVASAALMFAASSSSYAMKFMQVMKIGSKGKGDAHFRYVEDFDSSIDGKLLVTDATNAMVQVFDKNSKFITKWGR